MTKLRVTKIACLHCRGKGVVLVDLKCPTCQGERRISTERSLRLAVQQFKLANGGLLSGDYGADIRRRLQGDAAAVFAIAGQTPPWAEASA